MNKILIFLGSLYLILIVTAVFNPTFAVDLRVLKLRKYLDKFNTPLSLQAEKFVSEADANNLDYRLLPAISGVESTFGQKYIVGSYNAYGWGGGLIYFKSWPDGISQISAALTQKPYRGVTPEILAATYCPPNATRWAYNVRYFMEQIEATQLADKPVTNLAITL